MKFARYKGGYLLVRKYDPPTTECDAKLCNRIPSFILMTHEEEEVKFCTNCTLLVMNDTDMGDVFNRLLSGGL